MFFPLSSTTFRFETPGGVVTTPPPGRSCYEKWPGRARVNKYIFSEGEQFPFLKIVSGWMNEKESRHAHLLVLCTSVKHLNNDTSEKTAKENPKQDKSAKHTICLANLRQPNGGGAQQFLQWLLMQLELRNPVILFWYATSGLWNIFKSAFELCTFPHGIFDSYTVERNVV